MKRIMPFVLLLVGIDAGCEMPTNFQGSVKVNRQNGVTTSVEVLFPLSTTVYSRATTDALVNQLDSMVSDLKAARDQFPVNEPKQKDSR